MSNGDQKFFLTKGVGIVICCLCLSACQESKRGEQQLSNHKDSLSYAVGLDIGRNLKRQSIDLDLDVLARGMKDMYAGNNVALTDSLSRVITATFRRQMLLKHEEERKIKAANNKKEGDAFLAENRKKEGVVTLSSGLQYKIMKNRNGHKPTPGQTVTVNFRGTLLNGTEFDNSYSSGAPQTFSVNNVIKGWTEALQLMPTGSTWMLYIPSELAYGERGMGELIPPNATLIFEIELLECN